MSELQALTARRDELLAKIRDIEASCEGIENENNAQRVQELNLEHAQLSAQKQELSAKLSAMETKLSSINAEIAKLSGTGIDRILEAIKNQRWYFFKNKTKLMFDKQTGLLFPNLAYYNIGAGGIWSTCTGRYSDNPDLKFLNDLEIDGIKNWELPTSTDIKQILNDSYFPFYHNFSNNRSIRTNYNSDSYWIFAVRVSDGGGNRCYAIDTKTSNEFFFGNWNCGVFPKSTVLIDNSDYQAKVFSGNPNHTEKERLQFTLDLFVQNDLWPIFDDEEITELYKKIYYEKPSLLEQLQEVQTQIESLQNVVLISSTFDYTALLAKYDMTAIDHSVIKYYQAVQQWTEELMEKLDYYEKEKETVIHDFNIISLKLGKKYENSDTLTEEENSLLRNRQRDFAVRFSLGMNSIKSKILAVKHQADDLEYRIDEIDSGDDAIHQLALLEKEERASFAFVAENTAKIIRNALKKIEFFEANHKYVVWAINTWETWTEKYKVFKTTYRNEMKGLCEDDGIEEEIWQKWYDDWQSLRFRIEQKVQPVIERELRGRIAMLHEDEISVAQQIIAELEVYRNDVDKFYREERKGIYQNFVFQSGGDIQDKLETENKLYKLTANFQSALQSIIFNCTKAEDRIFILNWANDLLDIQIDDILALISDNDLDSISDTILSEFSRLKQKNYEIYLADAKSYAEEQARRDKQFNSLLFKMRKGLSAK